jgi:hypothetical protein
LRHVIAEIPIGERTRALENESRGTFVGWKRRAVAETGAAKAINMDKI